MHVQPLFREQRPDELHRLMRAYPLALVVVPGGAFIEADLLPLEVVVDAEGCVLRGHVSRQHTLAQAAPDGVPAMAVFQGPNAYISPRWYVAGQRSGRQAPSWNHVSVQARGTLRLVDDAVWVLTHLRALTAAQESARELPWDVDHAPADFVDEMAARLVGFELSVTKLEGKRFLSQQRTAADRESLVQHLAASADGMARALAPLIEP